MQPEYRKPIYDPWEIFTPAKSFIREVIKQLREQCYAIQAQIQKAKNCNPELRDAFIKHYQNRAFDVYRKEYNDIIFAAWQDYYQQKLDAVNRRIRDYQYRLRGVPGKSTNGITADDVKRAKESPISDSLGGRKFRRLGVTLVGKCPFHAGGEERTGSFVIYLNSNRWTCFAGCGNGDVIDVVMRQQNLKFPQAVRWILHL